MKQGTSLTFQGNKKVRTHVSYGIREWQVLEPHSRERSREMPWGLPCVWGSCIIPARPDQG